MASLIIDTSSWIQLAKPKFSGILGGLTQLIEDERLEILSNQILIDEWNRNKEKAIDNIKSSIRSHAKSALKISEFISLDEAAILNEIIGKYSQTEAELLEIANLHYDKVDKLINECTLITISDNLKIRMSERAVSKKSPFHNSKNNMADALIIFSAIDWVDENKQIQTDLLFVTRNHTEFALPNCPEVVHPEILEDRKKSNLLFTNDIGRIIKLFDDNVENGQTQLEYQLWDWIESRYDEYR